MRLSAVKAPVRLLQMKCCFIAFGLFFMALSAQGNEVLESSAKWLALDDAYGQFRLVPSKVQKHVTEERGWDGPWGMYRNFVLNVGFANAHQSHPGNFDLVELSVAMAGSKDRANESSGTTVRLFDRASKASDIKITFHELPATVELDREYKAATIEGDDSLCTWDVYVRFSQSKPGYVREKLAAGSR
jgi:hypothetical protein